MKVYSTIDVPLRNLIEFSREAGADLTIEVDEAQFHSKSAEAPSLVALLANLTWWQALALAVATKYATTLAKSAAESTWKHKNELASTAASRVKKLAAAIAKLACKLKQNTQFCIGIPFPDEYFSTQLELKCPHETDLTVQILLFLQHLPDVNALIEELKQSEPATGIFLRLLEDGALEAYWFDRKDLQKKIRVFPLPHESLLD